MNDGFFHADDLVLHFFKFYSEWRSSEEVVAIHCPLSRTLSPGDAINLATDPGNEATMFIPSSPPQSSSRIRLN